MATTNEKSAYVLVQDLLQQRIALTQNPDLPPYPAKPEDQNTFSSEDEFTAYQAAVVTFEKQQEVYEQAWYSVQEETQRIDQQIRQIMPLNKTFVFALPEGNWAVSAQRHSGAYQTTVTVETWQEHCLRNKINPQTGIHFEVEREEAADREAAATEEALTDEQEKGLQRFNQLSAADQWRVSQLINQAVDCLGNIVSAYGVGYGKNYQGFTEAIAPFLNEGRLVLETLDDMLLTSNETNPEP